MALLVACSSPTAPVSTSGTPSSESAPTALAPSIVPLEEFCAGMSLPPGAEQRTLRGPDGAQLNSVWLGKGSTTAVLLHQIDGNGACGFLFYAAFLAQQRMRVVVLDLCEHGQSSCIEAPSLSNDPAGQVRVATDAARAAGADRVVLVGASMGGSYAVTAASATRADAIVDLSGPAVFNGVSDIDTDAANVTMPALFAFTSTDPQDLAAVRKALPRMPSRNKTFRVLDIGHGYDLLRDLSTGELTPFAGQVAEFVRTGRMR